MPFLLHRLTPRTFASLVTSAFAFAFAFSTHAQAPSTQPLYLPGPAFDLAAIDRKADPCADFYAYACGNFAKLHPIPANQTAVDQFQVLDNVDTQALNGILTEYAVKANQHTPNEQKTGDFYAACTDAALIEQKGLSPVQPLLDEIAKVTLPGIPYLAGELQRIGVPAFFGFGEMQDFKDATRQIAVIDQGGLGLPERDYYTRTGDKDKLIRDQYVAHITKVLTFSGEPAAQAAAEARNILAFETALALASQTNTERRDPEAIYHPQTLTAFEASFKPAPFAPFLEAIHAPAISSLNVTNPGFFPALIKAAHNADIATLRAYLRFHLLDTFAENLPKRFDDEQFDFYRHTLRGQQEPRPRTQRCSYQVDTALGEALGEVYVSKYFAGDSKAKTLEMVHDIESAMNVDLDSLTWMGPATKVRAHQKLAAIADKIGYPDHWRSYTALTISATDAFGNVRRATAFENDRQLAKIGQPVDKLEWSMTPPTVNAYYDPSMNNINFPAGILQPAFYDPKADIATNYGHIGAVIGHELTHGFDDEGKKFDFAGNLNDWWTPEDTRNFEQRTSCLVNEYGAFTAVGEGADAVKVNGKLTLGENTADNGGLVLAYMAYLARARKDGLDITRKVEGFTGPQRLYIAYAQNWCENSRPESVRQQVLTNEHSPDHFRANGAIVNQPGFGPAFGCKPGSPMTPANACRVW